MIRIEYPEPDFRIKKTDETVRIFDSIRRQWVVLTPEEWVRQNLLAYLIKVKSYPASLFSIEKEIMLGDLRKRCDIIIYDRSGQPWMIIECKEKTVVLNRKVIDQILRYHSVVPVPFLLISNGELNFCFEKTEGVFKELILLPEYQL